MAKIHRVSKFKQSDWLKTHTDFNTEKKEAVNSFENYFFKRMINSVYCKTIEKLRKKTNVRLVNNAKYYRKYVSKPSFVSYKTLSKDLIAIHEIKPVLILDKPIFVGFSVLDLNEILMYDFHYNYIKIKLDAELLFTNTDSLTYEIKTEDVYEDFFRDKHLLDFTEYLKDPKFYNMINEKVIGKMKDGFRGSITIKFVGLKSKMYFVGAEDGKIS